MSGLRRALVASLLALMATWVAACASSGRGLDTTSPDARARSAAADASTTPAVAPASGRERRVALVIGNGRYAHVAALQNTGNDARAMASRLESLGFEVIRVEDASQQRMVDAVRAFGDRLEGAVGLFYYAGHGVQVKGRNYLIPVDARIEHEDEVVYQALDVDRVLAKMESAGNPLNMVVLDACRNNPFPRRSRSLSSGLAQMDAPAGTLIAFATAPGAEADDGDGGNGLFTSHLLRYMNEPGLKVEDVFKRTRVAVRQASRGAQIPWESTSLEGDFYFLPGKSDVVANASSTRVDAKSFDEPPAAAMKVDRSAKQVATKSFSFSEADRQMDEQAMAPDLKFQREAANCRADGPRPRVRVDLHETPGPWPNAFTTQVAERLLQIGIDMRDAGPVDYVIGGTSSTMMGHNGLVALNEMSMSSVLQLRSPDGQLLAQGLSSRDAYSGMNPAQAYALLARDQAAETLGALLGRMCRP